MTGSETASVAAFAASGGASEAPSSKVKTVEKRDGRQRQPPSPEKLREASEVFLLMHRNCRVSRNIRANWYFEHLGKPVQIYSGPSDLSKEFLVYGMTAANGADDEIIGTEKLLFTKHTRMTFFAKLYRQVYVLDLSPSTLVADDDANCCLFTLLIEHLKTCLYSLTRQMVLPGNKLTLRPAFYITVLVYTPYLTFKDRTVLVQNTLVNHINVGEVMEDLTAKFNEIIKSLHAFTQPIVDEWGKRNDEKRRQYAAGRTDGGPPPPRTGILKEFVLPQYDEFGELNHEPEQPPGAITRLPTDSEMSMELEEMGYARQIWSDVSGEATASSEGGAVFANASSIPPVEGYIHPEWSLIFMIRMAMLACQMLPENTQSNIILITDAVCGMPEPSALHDLLVQLRSMSIACSFIQVQGRVRSEPSFGHVASCELFHFLAVATFGAYLPNCKCILSESKKGLNTYQKQLMCFWFEKALQRNTHILSIVREVNEMFAEMYLNDIRRHRESRLNYECSVRDLMYVRLREGYTLKEIREGGGRTVIVMILPIRQLSSLEYTITANGSLKYRKRQPLSAEVTLVAPYNVLQELIAAPTTTNPTRQKAVRAYRDIVDGIVESDRILTHLHSFYTQRSYYTIPEGLTHCAIGLFRAEDPPPTKLEYEEEFFTRPRFDKFWCQLIDVEERIWQKWTHTHPLRLVLTPTHAKCRLFTRPDDAIDFTRSLDILHEYLTLQSSFCLLHEQIYVVFVGGSPDLPPRQFYIIRLTGQPPLITIRVSFIGGMTNHMRVDIIRDLCDGICRLRFVRGRNPNETVTEQNSVHAVTLLRRPIERMMITYTGVPTDVHSMIASTTSGDTIPSVSEHNALSKFLQARRVIWKMASMFCDRGGDLPPQITNYFTEMMLRRRLSLGYQLIWLKKGIVGLCRQSRAERETTSLEPTEDMMTMSEESSLAIEQFVLFPPVSERSEIDRISASIDDSHPQGCPASKVDVVIVQEMWLEPGEKTDKSRRLIAEEVLLASLFTIDKLLRICAIGGVAAPVKSFSRHRELGNGTETRLIQFSLGSLMRNSQRHLMLLPFHCPRGMGEEDLRRAQMTMDILHDQLRENSECTLRVDEKHKWTEMVGDMEKTTELFADINRGTPFIIYMRKTSPWSVVGVAIPSEKEKIRDWRDGVLPLLFFSSEEPSVAYAAMTGAGGLSYIEDRRKAEVGGGPVQREVPDDFVLAWRGETEGGGFKSFDLTGYVRNMYDNLVMKTMVTAMFKAVNEGIIVSEKAVQDVTEEYCDFINLEVEGVDAALRTYCSHMREVVSGDRTRCSCRCEPEEGSSHSCNTMEKCTDETEFELSFSSILSRYFKPVAGCPSYYHFLSKDSPLLDKMGNGRFLNRLAPSHKKSRHGHGDLLNFSSDEEEEYLYYKTSDGKILRKPEDIFPMRMYSIESSDESAVGSMENLVDACHMLPIGERRAKFESRDQYPLPLFLYFSCGVRLPTGEMETFPINSLPSCIHHLVKRANLPLTDYNIDDVRVSVDLYVLTWPMQIDAHIEGTEGASYAAAKKKMFLKLLPSKERAVVHRLSHSISYLIEQEMVLMDSRRREISLDRVERIWEFIARELNAPKDEKDDRYDEKTKKLGLVIATPEAKERLKERMDGMYVDYSQLKRVGNSDLFYACKVVDQRRFTRHFIKEPSLPAPPVIETEEEKEERAKYIEEQNLEERRRIVKNDVMRQLGYTEECAEMKKVVAVEKELREESEREDKVKKRREEKSGKKGRKRMKPYASFDTDVEKSEENGRNGEGGRGDWKEEGRKKGMMVDGMYPMEGGQGETEDEKLRLLQELHEPQLAGGRRRIIDMDSLDLTKKDVTCDFWVLMRITDHIQIEFCQRYAHFRHTIIFEETWRKAKRALKVTNQQMLLEKAHETSEVNSLLLLSNRDRREYGSECQGDEIEVDPDSVVEDDNSRDQVTESARYLYTPGTFACPMVHHHWFVVPPRLKTYMDRNEQARALKNRQLPEKTAIDVLRTGLHTFAATNVDNVYLFKDRLGAVFYMHLHVNIQSVEKMSKTVPEDIRREAENGQFATNILLAVHGVDRPNEEITIDLPEMLQRQLNASHLDKIIAMFAKNKKSMLEAPDVLFIQPEPRDPSRLFHFTLPAPIVSARLLSAFEFYLRQHINHEWPEVRYRGARSGVSDRLHELRMMNTEMSITPTMEGAENAVEESDFTDGCLAVSIPIPFVGGRDAVLEEEDEEEEESERGARMMIDGVMGDLLLAETPELADDQQSEHTVRSAPEVRRERALRKLSGHIYRGKKSFEAHTSAMTPKLPPNYQPQFNIICKAKQAGSTAYGFAVAEMRLLNRNGSVMEGSQSRMGKSTTDGLKDAQKNDDNNFDLLTGTEDVAWTRKWKKYRQKQGRFSRFWKAKMEGQEEVIVPQSFMVEVVVWQMGDVGEEYVKAAASAFIRQALADVVTEYWMFTLPIFDAPPPPPEPLPSPLKSTLVHKEKEPSRSGGVSRSLSFSDENLASSRSSLSLSPGVILDDDDDETCCGKEACTPTFIFGGDEVKKERVERGLTENFLTVLEWFDYVAESIGSQVEKGGIEMMSVQKKEMECTSVHAAKKVTDVINQLLRGKRYGKSAMHPDTVGVTERNEKASVFTAAKNDQWKGITGDLGVDLDTRMPVTPPTVAVVSLAETVWADSMSFSTQCSDLPPLSLAELLHEDKREQFAPRFPIVNKQTYIPRLRFIAITLTGKTVSLYTYNLRHDLHLMMGDDLLTALQWHEAKMLLLRQIGLQKMGITHLAPTQELPSEEGGSYATRIWRCTESYLESDFPPGHSCEKTPKECILSMSRLYRGVEPAFVTAGLTACRVADQFTQLNLIRSAARNQLLPHHYLSGLHARMMMGSERITYADLCELVHSSRETHFVMTPILLFPQWRRKIASIRAPEKDRERLRNATEKQRNASTASGMGGVRGFPSGRGRNISTLSASNSHASALSLPATGRSPSLRLTLMREDEDPHHMQLEAKLLSEYIEYLISLGMKPVTVDRRPDRNGRQPTGGKIVRWNHHPEQWLVTAVDGGLLLAHLCFTPPYFHVRFRMWHLLGVFSTVEDDHEKLKMRNLERAKDELVSACHVHSFTYDFHLRTISKYLLGRDHIVFMPGYNTSAFLIDFLQYYGCRPPCARNCIYEERISFPLQHGVLAENVWAHFLKHDKLYEWRVVKMKQSDDDGNQSADFMLIQSSVDQHQERDEVKIVVHERSPFTPHSLNLVIYMVMVNKSHKTPLTDERRREDSRASEGEFKHVAPFHPPPAVPTKEKEKEGDEKEMEMGVKEREREDSGQSRDGIAPSTSVMPALRLEIERMVNLVNEGILPSVVDGSTRRRRHSSAGGKREEKEGEMTPVVLTPRNIGESDSGSVSSLVSPPSPTLKENQLTIQENAPRRHRRREESRMDGMGLPIAHERAIYVHFLSSRQRKLQKIVEDATTKYRLQLQKCVQDAEFACRRDTLWQRMVSIQRHATKKESGGGFFRQVITDPWHVARTAAMRGREPSKDLDTLISIVHKERMAEKEPGLAQLLRGLLCAGLCRHLVAKFGVDRCRFFDYSHSSKKALLITNPNCLLDAAILVTCVKETSPDLIMMVKEYDDNDENVSEKVRSFKQNAIDSAFDEVVSTVIAYVWSTLNTRMEVP